MQPDKPGDKSHDEIVTILGNHYSPKPLINAERFRFHKRNLEEGESVSQFVAVLKWLSEQQFGLSLNDTYMTDWCVVYAVGLFRNDYSLRLT